VGPASLVEEHRAAMGAAYPATLGGEQPTPGHRPSLEAQGHPRRPGLDCPVFLAAPAADGPRARTRRPCRPPPWAPEVQAAPDRRQADQEAEEAARGAEADPHLEEEAARQAEGRPLPAEDPVRQEELRRLTCRRPEGRLSLLTRRQEEAAVAPGPPGQAAIRIPLRGGVRVCCRTTSGWRPRSIGT